MRYLLATTVAALSLSGCASLKHTLGSEAKNKVYIGTKKDWNSIVEEGCGGAIFICEGVNPIFDLPFSAVMDTLLLPYTITHRVSRSDSEKMPASEPLVAQQAVPADVAVLPE